MLSIGPKYKYINKPSAFKKIDNKHIIISTFFCENPTCNRKWWIWVLSALNGLFLFIILLKVTEKISYTGKVTHQIVRTGCNILLFDWEK